MTLAAKPCATAPSVDLGQEAFKDYAWAELAEHPLFEKGVCAYPDCSCDFDPSHPQQLYCSTYCRRKDEQEMRKFGERIAKAMLAHQLGKHERENSALRELSNAGRRYASHVQSTWVKGRIQRKKQARFPDGEF